MAIRRISDLPNVETVSDGNPNIASCLFEVSHRDPDEHSIFKSYYMTGIDVANQIYNDERLSNCVKLSADHVQVLSSAVNFSKGFYLVDTNHPVNTTVKTQNELTNVYPTRTDVLVTPGALLPYLTATYMKNDSLYGHEGEIVYVTPESIKKQTVFRNDIYICENDDDQEKCELNNFTFQEVFNSWIKSGRVTITVDDHDETYVYGYTEYPKNIRTLNEMFSDSHGHSASLTSYQQLISGNPATDWHLYQWWWKNEDGSLTSLVPTEACPILTFNQQAYGYEYWVYNDTISSIIQPMNSHDYTAYLSPQLYTDYDLEVELKSASWDNDYVGLVAAFNEDSNGVPRQLNLMRVGGVNDKGLTVLSDSSEIYDGDRPPGCKDDSWYTWYAEADSTGWPRFSSHGKCVKSVGATVGGAQVNDDLQSESVNKINRTWGGSGATKIKIQRRGNMLTAMTTPFYKNTEADYDVSAKIVIDLASFQTYNGTTYNCFSKENGGGRIGFIAESQPMTYYRIISFKVPQKILRIDKNEMITINVDGTRTSQIGRFTDELGIGRFIKNNVTNKTFYISDSAYIKVASYGTEDWKFTIQNGASVEEITKKVMVEQ